MSSGHISVLDTPETVLVVRNLEVSYGGLCAVRSVSLRCARFRVHALIGANGSGKSSTLKAIMGLVRPKAGEIECPEGVSLKGRKPHWIARNARVAYVPEGRGILARMTVSENLEMGTFVVRDKRDLRKNLEHVYATFPVLSERRKQAAGTLSGGEQQMLAIARALTMEPRLLLIDEPSFGLAPLVVAEILDRISEIAASGTAVLIVEQNVNLAVKSAQWVYLYEEGRVVLEGPPERLAADDRIRQAYLGG